MILISLLMLNQFFKEPLVEGFNDSFSILWVLLMLLFLQRKKLILAAVALALGVMTKQYLATLAPFFILFSAFPESGELNSKNMKTFLRKSLKVILPFAAVVLALVVPFFISDAEATWRGFSGPMAERFPMRGYAAIGLDSILLYFGIDSKAFIPGAQRWFRILLAVPFLIFLMIRQIRNNTPAAVLENASALTFFIFLFTFGGFYLHWFGPFTQFFSLAVILFFYGKEQPAASGLSLHSSNSSQDKSPSN